MLFDLEPKIHEPGKAFQECLEAVVTDRPFVYAKLNHGFWERLVRIRRLGFDPTAIAETDMPAIERKLGAAGTAFLETGFLQELLEILQNLPAPSTGFRFAATVDAWPLSHEIEGTPRESREQCLWEIEARVSPDHIEAARRTGMTGHEFKSALITRRFQEFSGPLAAAPFLLIANAGMARFPDFIGARSVQRVEIDGRNARNDRRAILDEVLKRIEKTAAPRRIVMQAGGSLSTWLCHHLFRARSDIQIFDLGNAMSICNPEVARRQNWVSVYCRSLFRGTEAVHPGWLRPSQHAPAGGRHAALDPLQSDLAVLFRQPKLVDLSRERGVEPPSDGEERAMPVAFPDAPVPFVENKAADLRRVEQLLELSRQSNHHANGGPVSRLLEDGVARLLGLPADRRVVACSSATSALFLAASLCAYRAGRRTLRWVTSACGFFSCNIGPLADTTILDCEESGRFSLERLRELPPDSWDGVIFTNLFACHSDWGDVRTFCRDHGKYFIVDNAVGLLDRPEDAGTQRDIEAISCHHTKPWGMGEGGLLIVEERDEAVIRDLMNFAARMPAQAHPHAMNAKLSDLAAAAIYDRLEQLPRWSAFYRMQERRVLSVIEDHEIPLHIVPTSIEPRSPRSYLPLLAPGPVAIERLQNRNVVLRKYYRPLVPTPTSPEDADVSGSQFPNAKTLYDRIVCCPCNPELRLLASEQLADALARASG